MVEIVRATEGHVSDIGRLWLEFMRFHQDIEPIFAPRDGAVSWWEDEAVRRLMKSEEGLVLVAVDEGQVVGFSLSEIRGPSKVYSLDRFGAIDTMAVTARYRRRGVGEAMLSDTLKWFRSNKIDRVELEVLARNRLSSSFWRKHGFSDYRHRLYRRI